MARWRRDTSALNLRNSSTALSGRTSPVLTIAFAAEIVVGCQLSLNPNFLAAAYRNLESFCGNFRPRAVASTMTCNVASLHKLFASPESFRGGNYNFNIFNPGRNGFCNLVSPRHSALTQFEIQSMLFAPIKSPRCCYCFSEREEVLLLERAQEPNRGMWSPCGGKLKMDIGESPYACAAAKAHEETGQSLRRKTCI